MTAFDPQDMVTEFQHNLQSKDFVKAQVILNHLQQVNSSHQRRILAALMRSVPEVATPLLQYLKQNTPELYKQYPVLEESLVSNLLTHPELLPAALAQATEQDIDTYLPLVAETLYTPAVPELIALLERFHTPQRLQQVLAYLGNFNTGEALNTLNEFLYAGSRDLVLSAVTALGQNGSTTALQHLAQRMGTDSTIDATILDIFRHTQDTVSLEQLNAHLSSPDAYLRNFAKSALRDIGNKAVPWLCQNLQQSHDSDLMIHSLNLLAEIQDATAAAPIRKLLTQQPHNANVRFAAYEALAQLPLSKGAYALANGLHDPEEQVRLAAASAIDRNFNDLLANGLKNMVRCEDMQAETLIRTVIQAQSRHISTALLTEPFFQTTALAVLQTAAPENRSFFKRLWEEQGYSQLAAQIPTTETTKKHKPRICAVDDSRMVLSLYKNSLYELGCDPVLFEFPQTALEWLWENPVDLVLTDLNMPELTGIDLAQQLREHYAAASLPIIMVTTQSDARDQKQAWQAGINDILFKPFTSDSLGQALQSYIPGIQLPA